jgi:uncharacterized protein YqeY
VSPLRSALCAIDNAETPDGGAQAPVPDAEASAAVAGAMAGLGSAEVPRKVLTDNDIRALIDNEVRERLDAGAEYVAAGRLDHAHGLRGEAAVLIALLEDI